MKWQNGCFCVVVQCVDENCLMYVLFVYVSFFLKAVFELARKKQPSVIFFDEIDALLSSRKVAAH